RSSCSKARCDLMAPNTQPCARQLDSLNFFLADVRDGLGPYLPIYLLTVQHWDEASIGVVVTIGGIAGIIAQTPAGAFIDATRFKSAALIASQSGVTVGSLALAWVSDFSAVAIVNALTHAAGSI